MNRKKKRNIWINFQIAIHHSVFISYTLFSFWLSQKLISPDWLITLYRHIFYFHFYCCKIFWSVDWSVKLWNLQQSTVQPIFQFGTSAYDYGNGSFLLAVSHFFCFFLLCFYWLNSHSHLHSQLTSCCASFPSPLCEKSLFLNIYFQ